MRDAARLQGASVELEANLRGDLPSSRLLQCVAEIESLAEEFLSPVMSMRWKSPRK